MPQNTLEKNIVEIIHSNGNRKVKVETDICTFGNAYTLADIKLNNPVLVQCVIDYKNNTLEVQNGNVFLNDTMVTGTAGIEYPSLLKIDNFVFRIDKEIECNKCKEESNSDEVKGLEGKTIIDNQLDSYHGKELTVIEDSEESESTETSEVSEQLDHSTDSAVTTRLSEMVNLIQSTTPMSEEDMNKYKYLEELIKTMPPLTEEQLNLIEGSDLDIEMDIWSEKDLEPEMYSDDSKRVEDSIVNYQIKWEKQGNTAEIFEDQSKANYSFVSITKQEDQDIAGDKQTTTDLTIFDNLQGDPLSFTKHTKKALMEQIEKSIANRKDSLSGRPTEQTTQKEQEPLDTTNTAQEQPQTTKPTISQETIPLSIKSTSNDKSGTESSEGITANANSSIITHEDLEPENPPITTTIPTEDILEIITPPETIQSTEQPLEEVQEQLPEQPLEEDKDIIEDNVSLSKDRDIPLSPEVITSIPADPPLELPKQKPVRRASLSYQKTAAKKQKQSQEPKKKRAPRKKQAKRK
ncbi:hypothetical protein NEOKW01_1397 [Nematocida sp. AWRm80]|nr:hypothetical protein NEOKW01_1397 [Nematocida sp. AWRm80]